MDKSDLRNKRKQDKHHKKVPPPKPAKQTVKPKVPEVQHTAPVVVCDYRYGKRQIEQNWNEDRDLPVEGSDSDDEQLNAADFEKLLSVPPSTSGHFLLSSEKHWLEPDTGLLGEEHKNRYSEYFRIDTKLLNASLGCIPFYQRHGYDESLFSAHEINVMRQKAEIQTAAYQKLCKEVDSKLGNVSEKENMPLPAKPQPVPCLVGKYALPKSAIEPVPTATQRTEVKLPEPAVVVAVEPVESKMSALKINAPVVVETLPPPTSSVLPSKPSNAPPATTAKDTKEDIQQWLDDILEI